jgi:STE24 endopeptidase
MKICAIGPRFLCASIMLFSGAAALHAAPAAFDPVAETQRLLDAVPADVRAKSDAYAEGGYWLQLWGALVTCLIAWVVYRTGWVVGLRNLAERVFRKRFLQGMFFTAMLLPVLWALGLPWDFYTDFIREHHYGMSNQTAAGWLAESALGQVPTVILLSPLIALLYLALRRWPRFWWVAASIVTPFFLVFVIMIAPVFIEPLFNSYRPVSNPQVREQVLSLARANGVPASEVYEFDASRQTKRISANVSGAFGTIRIALNDNLLNRCSPAEVQAVMAHELGHYVLNHTAVLSIEYGLVFVAGFVFLHWFFGLVLRRRGTAWGLRGIDDLAGLPVLIAGLILFMLLATPVTNTISRTVEGEADIFGINAGRQPDGMAGAAIKVAEYRKLVPGPVEEFVFYDHPSGYRRILMAMRWKAEHLQDAPPAH